MSDDKPTTIRIAFIDGGGNPDDDPEREAPSDNERWYDEHVAPALRKIGEACVARGMSLVAKCEIDRESGLTGSSRFVSGGGPGFKFLLTWMADVSEGNVDRLIGNIRRYAREHGGEDASIYLTEIAAYERSLRGP